MGKFKQIKLDVLETEDGQILWNTGDGIAILLEEYTAYHQIHKYFGRAIEKSNDEENKTAIVGYEENKKLNIISNDLENILRLNKLHCKMNNSQPTEHMVGAESIIKYVIQSINQLINQDNEKTQ